MTSQQIVQLDLLALSLFACFSAYFLITDIRFHRLPNRAMLVAALSGGVVAIAASLEHADIFLITQYLVRALTYGLVMLAVWLLSNHSLGAGDVKLTAVIGGYSAFVPASAAHTFIPISIAVISLVVVVVAIVCKQNRFAYGPVLLAGFWSGAWLSTRDWL